MKKVWFLAPSFFQSSLSSDQLGYAAIVTPNGVSDY